MDGPRSQGILTNPRTRCRCPKRPSCRTIITAKNSLFLTHFRAASSLIKKCVILSNPYPRLWFDKGYLEMGMYGPCLQEIMAKSYPIGHLPKRPPFRGLIADTDSISLPHFRAPSRVGKKCAKLSNPYLRLGFGKRAGNPRPRRPRRVPVTLWGR